MRVAFAVLIVGVARWRQRSYGASAVADYTAQVGSHPPAGLQALDLRITPEAPPPAALGLHRLDGAIQELTSEAGLDA